MREEVRQNLKALAWAIALLAMLCLPMMSAYALGGQVSGTLMVRGFNLVEFGWWGIVPLVAPFFLTWISCSVKRSWLRFCLSLVVAVGTSFGIYYSILRAHDWLLKAAGTTVVDYGCGLPLYAAAFFAIGIVVTGNQRTS